MRKALLAAAVALLALADATAADPLKVTLLGTGTPTPRVSNFSAATLVEAGPEKLLFDFGRGSTMRLFQKQIPLGALTAHFITHLHSDHLVGLPDMWLSGWLGTSWASRKTPMVVFGPKGTVAMTENLTKHAGEQAMTEASASYVYVGARTTKERNARGDGLNVYRMDNASGAWTHLQLLADLVNPSFLAFDRTGRFLYTVHGDLSDITAMAIDPADGTVTMFTRGDDGRLAPTDKVVKVGSPVCILFKSA